MTMMTYITCRHNFTRIKNDYKVNEVQEMQRQKLADQSNAKLQYVFTRNMQEYYE